MTKQDLLIEKFHACTGVQRHIISGWYEHSDINKMKGIDVDKALRIIMENNLNQYSTPLLKFLELYANHNIRYQKSLKTTDNNLKEANKKSNEELKKKEELVNFMEHILTKGKVTMAQIYMKKGSASLEDQGMIDNIVDTVKQEFIKQKYHFTPLNMDKVKSIFKKHTDVHWFNEWGRRTDIVDKDGHYLDFKEYDENQTYYDREDGTLVDMDVFFDEMFFNYSLQHPKERTIDIELINFLKKGIEEEQIVLKRRTGGAEKNKYISYTAVALADLARIDEFLSRADIHDIGKITVNNKVGKFIYDMLVLFEMIEEKTGTRGNSERHKAAKDLIRNKLNQTTPDYWIRLRSARLSLLKSEHSRNAGGVNS